jgi:hypothetical protein
MKQILGFVIAAVCLFIGGPAYGADPAANKAANALTAEAQRLEHKARQRNTSADEAKELFSKAQSLREEARQVRAGIANSDAVARQQRMATNRVSQQARAAQQMQQQLERQQPLNQFGATNPTVAGLPYQQLPIQTASGIFYPGPVPYRGGINGITQSVYTVRRNVNSFKNLANTFRSFNGMFKGW